MSLPFKLPPLPVDGFVLRLWKFDGYSSKLTEFRAVYHVNTPIDKVFPGETRGAPFEDEWAVYHNDRLQGRNESWEWRGDEFNGYFATEAEAAADGCACLHMSIAKRRREIVEMSEALKALGDVPTPLDVAIRQLFEDTSKNYQGYDIVSGWNLKPGTDEANTALTALDVVIQDLMEKAITG
jgi:hypothetical protein